MILKVIAISLVMMSSAVDAYNILVVAPMPFKSHWIWTEKIIEKLISRGYDLTTISPFKYRREGYTNEYLHEIQIPKLNVENIFPSKNFFNGKFESDISYIQAQYKMGLAVSEHTLVQPNVKELINNQNQKFDVVLVDSSHQDSLYMFAEKFKCPLITIDVNGHSNSLDEAMGIMTPHSFVPHPSTKYDKEMTYLQRCYNALLYVYEAAVRRFSYIPAQNKLANKHFRGGIQKEPLHIQDVINKISLVLSNTFQMVQNRPTMAAQVSVAGLHIDEIYSLPTDLKELLQNAHNSVIYFSLGSHLKPSELPKEKLDGIIKAFSKIKKTVLWQYDGDIPAGLPDNIIMEKWFPQNDLLANKKVVLFITQGGTLSFQEGLSNRVPMLIIPFTGEQHRNGRLAEKGHFGKMVEFDDINEDTLSAKMTEILEDNTYFTGVTKAESQLLRSPVEPIRKAAFWIEQVCEYKGIEKPPSVNYSWFTYSSVDVLAFYLGILMVFILFWTLTIKSIVRRYQQREQKGKFKYY